VQDLGEMKDATVRSLVRRPPVFVDAETTLRRVAEILAQESIGAVVVRHQPPAGSARSSTIGVVSERDISHAVAAGLDPDQACAADVMTPEVALAEPDESIRRVAARMMANEVRHLPVSEDDELIGVVSERDVLHALVQALHEQSTV
jgi:CBS domain-containing protein